MPIHSVHSLPVGERHPTPGTPPHPPWRRSMYAWLARLIHHPEPEPEPPEETWRCPWCEPEHDEVEEPRA
jgi:hypothetical protein